MSRRARTVSNITLKDTTANSIYTPYVKGIVYGGTNLGKTYLVLNSYFNTEKKKKVLFINTDQPENFLKNFNHLTDAQKLRVVQPHEEMKIGHTLDDVKNISPLIKQILTPPISKEIHDGTIGLIVIDTIDVIQEAYENNAMDNDFSGTPEMFVKGRGRAQMEREFLKPLIKLPCNFIATSAFDIVYKEGKGPLKDIATKEVDGKDIHIHKPRLNAKMWKHFTNIMELRDIYQFDEKKSQINGYFIKSKRDQGLYTYNVLKGDKESGKGPSYAKYMAYDRGL